MVLATALAAWAGEQALPDEKVQQMRLAVLGE
jgi:hypothetical protein